MCCIHQQQPQQWRMTTTFQSNKNEKLGIGSHLMEVEKTQVLQESTPKSEEIFCRGGLYKLIFQVKDKLHTTTAYKNRSIFQYQISITIHVLLYSWSNPATLSESPPSAWSCGLISLHDSLFFCILSFLPKNTISNIYIQNISIQSLT